MTRLKFSLRVTAFCAVLPLAIFFAENSLARTLYRFTLKHYNHGSQGLEDSGRVSYYWSLSPTFSPYEFWPFLAKYNTSSDQFGNRMWWPYGYQVSQAPFGYGYSVGYYTQTIPDSFDQSDVDTINDEYSSFSPAQQAAISGTLIAGETQNGQEHSKFYQFNTKTIGTDSNGGVVTYDSVGRVIVSYPDNTGYASGFKPNPDGTYTPVYYQLQSNGSFSEVPYIPTADYSSLVYDDDTGRYTLSVPDYREKLDLIVNKIDGIRLDPVINVSAPEVTVNPTVTVTPDVTVNVGPTDLSDIEDSLVSIGDLLDSSLGTDSDSGVALTNEVGLTVEEQGLISQYRTWETGIPVVGSTLDFGLTALFGRLPVVGQEFEWMDVTPDSSGSQASFLSGLRIRISLDQYRNLILAFRGWIIIAEAIYFGILIWKLIREALAV